MEDASRMTHFEASDGISLAYVVDDFTDPWAGAPPTQPAPCRLKVRAIHSAWGSVMSTSSGTATSTRYTPGSGSVAGPT